MPTTSTQAATVSAWNTKPRLRVRMSAYAASTDGSRAMVVMARAGPTPKSGAKAQTRTIAAPAAAANASASPLASSASTKMPAGSQAAIGRATSAIRAASPAARKVRTGLPVIHCNSAVIGTHQAAGPGPGAQCWSVYGNSAR